MFKPHYGKELGEGRCVSVTLELPGQRKEPESPVAHLTCQSVRLRVLSSSGRWRRVSVLTEALGFQVSALQQPNPRQKLYTRRLIT